MKFCDLTNHFFIFSGPNVIESEEHTLKMASELKNIYDKYDIKFAFKTSFDKANRSSLNSYRGLGFDEGLRILKKVKDEVNVPIITDIHESWQAKPVGEIVDIIQIPAFLCRQTDLLKAAAETGKIIHIKKGQMCSAEQMHKCKEKLIEFGNSNVILCERGNSFGYQDLIVDPRNLIWLQSDTNLVTMDITHCLQKPSQKMEDGTIKCGGYRDLIPYMGKMAISLGVNGLFIEVHDNPEDALCDGPTQWPFDKLEWLLDFLDINEKRCFKNLKIPNLNCDPLRYCLNNNLINQGLWLEFGVWKGQTLQLISNYTNNNVYGFDSFYGFNDESQGEWKTKNYSLEGNIPKKIDELDKFERKLSGKVVDINTNVKFVVGLFNESIPKFIEENDIIKKGIDFMHIDCDTYESTKCILDNLKDYINNNCIIVFDELINFPNFVNGEIKALYEWIDNDEKISIEYIGTEENYHPEFNDYENNTIFWKNLRKNKIGCSVAIKVHINNYDFIYKSSSITEPIKAELGTIEKDSHGLLGWFDKEACRAEKILNKFLENSFDTILDIGAGELKHTNIFIENNKIVDICDFGNSIYYKKRNDNSKIRNKFIGDFNKLNVTEKYDAIWCSHILEHQLNVNFFLKKLHSLLHEGGYLAIIVPPRKPFIIGGHVTIWNAGLVLYNLILAGFDCSEYCKIEQYDYNIGIIIKKKTINKLPENLSMDRGDIELLNDYFPFEAKHGFNGDLIKH